MKKLVILLAVLSLVAISCHRRGAILLPPPPPPMVAVQTPGVEIEVGPEVGPDVYYDGPFIIGGIPYWYYNGMFFVFEGGIYRFHHRCFGGCNRGFYDRHWHGGWDHHRSEWGRTHGHDNYRGRELNKRDHRYDQDRGTHRAPPVHHPAPPHKHYGK